MKPLVLHPTDMSQWHALLSEAQASTRIILNEDTESYLVFLLMRFSHHAQWLDTTLANDFFDAKQAIGRRQIELFQALGDKSLLLSGLFPEMAQRRHVALTYFTEMGQAAYLTVSELEEHQLAQLYTALSEQFLRLKALLQGLRGEGAAAKELIVQATHLPLH